MINSAVDLDNWPSERLLAALLDAAPTRGPREVGTTEVGASLLSGLGGIGGVARATLDELEERLTSARRLRLTPNACARRVAAAFELGRRAACDTAAPVSIANSADVALWASNRLSALDHEELWLLALDGRSRLRAVRCVAKGGLHGMGVRPADPLRLALRASASAFVLVHNHPSGDSTPSVEDIEFTRRVALAAAVVGMPLLDHVVVAREGFSSVPFSEGSSRIPARTVDA